MQATRTTATGIGSVSNMGIDSVTRLERVVALSGANGNPLWAAAKRLFRKFPPVVRSRIRANAATHDWEGLSENRHRGPDAACGQQVRAHPVPFLGSRQAKQASGRS